MCLLLGERSVFLAPVMNQNFKSLKEFVDYNGSVWGADMSGPQRQFSGEPTCRSPNADMLGSRQVCSRTPDSRPVGSPTTICWGADRSAPERQTADLSAPQRQFAGEPIGLGSNGRRCSIGCSGSGYWHKSCPETKVTIGRLYEYFVREK